MGGHRRGRHPRHHVLALILTLTQYAYLYGMTTTMTRASQISFLCTLLLCFTASESRTQGFFEFEYEVERLAGPINSEANDYAPIESSAGDRLFFTSYRDEGTIGEADIYQLSRPSGTPSGEWGRLLNPGSPFNTEGNDGSVALLRNDELIIFATEGRADGEGSTDLFIGRQQNGRVTSIRSLGSAINTEWWESQPAISADEKHLYFVSDRPGGEGKEDIWRATRSGEDADGFPLWSTPINLGPRVNTSGGERSPTLTLDGATLYYASDGLPGFGGYDIYMTTRTGEVWSDPANLGSIINSSRDDLFFFAPRNDHPFYFASARSGGRGGLDIYGGSPNVFGTGLFALTVTMTDDRGVAVAGEGVVVDSERGDTIARVATTTSRESATVHLPAGRSYRVIGRSAGIAQQKELPPGTAGRAERVDFRFGAISLQRIDLSDYTIPFFVTGYYRPNTAANLEELFELREGLLKPAGYVEDFPRGSSAHRQYREWSNDVEAMFSSVRAILLENIIPRFTATARDGDVLEIQVTGYTDPQAFEGVYHDRTATFYHQGKETEVAKGATITNLELSGLRAFYTTIHLNALLGEGTTEGAELFRRLRNEGSLRFVPMAGDVATDSRGTPFETQRRITVVVDVVRGG